MKHFLSIVALASATLVLAGPNEDIKAIHGQFSKAMLSGSFASMSKAVSDHTTPDFAMFPATAMRLNRAAYLDQLKKQLATYKYRQYGYTVGPVGPGRGGLATTATLKFDSTFKDAKGKPHRQVGSIVAEEQWILIGKTPKLRRMRIITTSISTDGKPPVKTGGGPRISAAIA